jgi:hypothetical protein
LADAGDGSAGVEPPAGFALRPLDLHVAAPGEAWVRMYRSIYPDPLGFGRVACPLGSGPP